MKEKNIDPKFFNQYSRHKTLSSLDSFFKVILVENISRKSLNLEPQFSFSIEKEIFDFLSKKYKVEFVPEYNRIPYYLSEEDLKSKAISISQSLDKKFVKIYFHKRKYELYPDILKDLDYIAEKFRREKIFFHIYTNNDFLVIRFYPQLTEEEKNILGRKLEPIFGHVVPFQGQTAILFGNDPVRYLSTFTVSSCRGIVVYCPINKIVALAHIDLGADYQAYKDIVRLLSKYNVNEKGLVVYVTKNFDRFAYEIISNKVAYSSDDLPSNFSFDRIRESIVDFDPKFLQDNVDYTNFLRDFTVIRFKYHISFNIVSYNSFEKSSR
ncbi:MAG: hypothetical protein N3D10_03945 [Candidatus Micrarchaeota archaeon]|nr:hypothetical protein [Candidatus Micrarchaeota archaeon]